MDTIINRQNGMQSQNQGFYAYKKMFDEFRSSMETKRKEAEKPLPSYFENDNALGSGQKLALYSIIGEIIAHQRSNKGNGEAWQKLTEKIKDMQQNAADSYRSIYTLALAEMDAIKIQNKINRPSHGEETKVSGNPGRKSILNK